MGGMKEVKTEADNLCSLCSSREFCSGCEMHLTVRGKGVVLNGLTREVIDVKEGRRHRKAR